MLCANKFQIRNSIHAGQRLTETYTLSLLFIEKKQTVYPRPHIPSIHWDHTPYRASVLPKQFPGLLGTILDGSLLQQSTRLNHGKLLKWLKMLKWLNHPSKLVLVLPTSEVGQAESTPPGINSTAKQDLNSES